MIIGAVVSSDEASGSADAPESWLCTGAMLVVSVDWTLCGELAGNATALVGHVASGWRNESHEASDSCCVGASTW